MAASSVPPCTARQSAAPAAPLAVAVLAQCREHAPELMSLVGWPIEVTDLPGLKLGRTRHLPPVDTGNRGPIVGVSTYDQETPVRLSSSGRTRHNYVLGPTGVGKSTLLANLALQDIAAGPSCRS